MIEQENRHGARRTREPSGAAVSFSFEGETVQGFPGDTVATALLAAGKRVLKITEVGNDPRGCFCIAGRCADCLVIIDGRANQRACTTPVWAGMDIRIQHGLGAVEREVQS